MKNDMVEAKLRQAFAHATPDVLDSILSDCEEQKGKVIIMNEKNTKSRKWKSLVAAAACLVLLLTGAVGFNFYRVENTVASTVSLDVNPSIEIDVNNKERVLSVKALNEDGKKVIGDMDFSGSSLEITVNALIGSMLRNGYISDLANSILISVDGADATASAALQQKLSQEVEALLKTDTFSGAVLSQTVSKDTTLETLAAQYGITTGKAQLIRELTEGNARYTFEELAPMSINELNLLRISGNATIANLSSVGSASDKAYIGEAKAKEAAYAHAGIAASAVRWCEAELDSDHGMLVYEIEFSAGDYEYDYEINALTGAVVKSKKEIDKDAVNAAGTSAGAVTADLIGEAKAKDAAYAHAGIAAAEVNWCKAKVDTDDGVTVYELDFVAGDYEYEYEINARTGAVMQYKCELTDTAKSVGLPKSEVALTEAEAKQVALDHAKLKVSDVTRAKIELDYDDGRYVYEVELRSGSSEYDYEIDAASGAILSYDIE